MNGRRIQESAEVSQKKKAFLPLESFLRGLKWIIRGRKKRKSYCRDYANKEDRTEICVAVKLFRNVYCFDYLMTYDVL